MGTAIFNAIFANVVGVFLTPLLAILILGAGKGVSLLRYFYISSAFSLHAYMHSNI